MFNFMKKILKNFDFISSKSQYLFEYFNNNYKKYKFEKNNTINLYSFYYNKYNFLNLIQYLGNNKIIYYQINIHEKAFIFVIENEDLYLLIPSDIQINLSYTDFFNQMKLLLNNSNKLENSFIKKLIYNLYSNYNKQKIKPIKNELEKIYKVVFVYDNEILINDHITTEYFVFNTTPKLEILPEKFKCTIYEIRFITNLENELLEVRVDTSRKIHPNVNYKDKNKYCIGNYRHCKLTVELINKIIHDMKVYNLTNCYFIPKELKYYIFNKNG